MLSLTRHEKYILVFLVSCGLLGASLIYFNKTAPSKKSYYSEKAISIKKANLKVQAPLNLNTATAEELSALKGIGAVLAARIIEYRRETGYFSRKEELKNVSGIGEQKFKEIENMVEVK